MHQQLKPHGNMPVSQLIIDRIKIAYAATVPVMGKPGEVIRPERSIDDTATEQAQELINDLTIPVADVIRSFVFEKGIIFDEEELQAFATAVIGRLKLEEESE